MNRAVRRVASAFGERERFLFDLNGYLVVRNVFSPHEVAAANAAIDAHADTLNARTDALRNTEAGTPLAAEGPRLDAGGFLAWPKPHCDPFRSVLAHPRLVPYYNALLGEGYRLDHQPLLIVQDRDSEGFMLHGGPVGARGRFNPELQYRCGGGDFWTSLLGVSLQLCDHNPGDGGFCVLPGSHKLNLPVPRDFAHGADAGFDEHIHHPATKAGDVVIWSEATVHGATPWRADRQRRLALYRFAPANLSYGRGYLDAPAAALSGLSDAERSVLEPPYAVRLERPVVGDEGAASTEPRSEAKKDFDRRLFGTQFF